MREPKPREAMTGVSAARPCPVCAGDHKCSVGDGGLILCGRRDGPIPSFRHLGPSRADPQFHLYRADDGRPAGRAVNRIARNRIRPHPSRAGDGRPGAAPRDWPAVARECAGRLTPDSRRALAQALGLPVEAFAAVPLLGAGPGGRYWTFPECDAGGAVVGVNRRFPDGSKKLMAGGKRGLTLAGGWRERPGPVFLVEGASDTLALTAAGLCAVGRPSNTGGVRLLARLLRDWLADRGVVVVGENDRKPDGSWPGRDGAEQTAARLARDLGRPVAWALPPAGAKDVRDWLTVRVAAGVGWGDAGRELLDALTAAAVEAGPAPGGGRPEVVIGVREHEVNDQAAAALGSDPDLYQRGGALVRVLVEPAASVRTVRRPAGPRIDLVPKPTLRERLTRAADWFIARETEGGAAFVPAHPPDWCVAAVHARGDWPAVRRLEAVVEYPVLLPDGRVPAEPGFDPDTGLLYAPPDGLTLDLPDPTPERVRRAVEDLSEAVADFPFEADAHRAAWVAALLTPLARFAFPGPAPLFLVDANVRGAGKGLLLHALSLMVTGEAFTVATYTHDVDELRKRITALALEGDRLVLFDNLDGRFGNAALDAALTSTAWKDRLLGQNKQASVPLWATWYATGNNVAVAADTARRVCHVRLETPEENPEGRGDFRHPDLLGWVRENRPRLLSAALTVLRGYVRAGRPDQRLPAWGSFEGWSGLACPTRPRRGRCSRTAPTWRPGRWRWWSGSGTSSIRTGAG